MLSYDKPHEKIHIYKNTLPEYSNIVSLIEELDVSANNIFPKWKTWFPSGAEGDESLAFGAQKRMSDHIDVKDDSVENNLYWSLFDAITKASNHYADVHEIKIGKLAPLSISKYKTGASMGRHTDSNGLEGPQTISVVCYLNDDYQGGEIRFAEQDVTIKPEAGSIVVFPSKPPFFHESMPVISGCKYISPGFWNIL
jgi:predicted 2-oxoglutarate/Fe(II)-dependent dioxygenase YbiX